MCNYCRSILDDTAMKLVFNGCRWEMHITYANGERYGNHFSVCDLHIGEKGIAEVE